MCFRPPDAKLKVLKCPECGKRINNPVYRPENCPYCGAYLPPELDGMDKVLEADPELAAKVGMAPKGAPKSPTAPFAPKVPGAPPAVKPVGIPAVTPVVTPVATPVATPVVTPVVTPVATPVATPIAVTPVTTPTESA